tara:strand:+ start:26 stop:487 length:462 start_codon:yes stop_codon:yes gene_type:complete
MDRIIKEDWWYHYKEGRQVHQYHKATANEDGNWEIDNIPFCLIDIKKVAKLLNDGILHTIQLKEIAWKGKHNFPYQSGNECSCCQGTRYINCDIKYPPIIAYNAPNPFNNKYRMIDGRHRIQKLLLNGLTESKFYVFDFNELRPFIIRQDKIY